MHEQVSWFKGESNPVQPYLQIRCLTPLIERIYLEVNFNPHIQLFLKKYINPNSLVVYSRGTKGEQSLLLEATEKGWSTALGLSTDTRAPITEACDRVEIISNKNK